jgi:hypothetical protein
MSTKIMKNTMLIGMAAVVSVVGTFAIATASPSWAATSLPNVAEVKAAASIQVNDVRYYRRGYARHGYARHGYYRRGYYGGGYYDPGAAAAAGVALGLFGAAAGAAAAAPILLRGARLLWLPTLLGAAHPSAWLASYPAFRPASRAASTSTTGAAGGGSVSFPDMANRSAKNFLTSMVTSSSSVRNTSTPDSGRRQKQTTVHAPAQPRDASFA